jgi:hypothetical protein
VSEISLELLAHTVLELMRLPKFENCDVSDLIDRAHGLLVECVRTIGQFEQGEYTYPQAIRAITGWQRISAERFKLFEEFYKETYLTFPSRPTKGSLFELHSALRTRQRQLQVWKERNSVPIKVCLEINRDFIKWDRKRRSEIDFAKGVKGMEAKKFKKSLASRKTDSRTSQRQEKRP